MKKTSILIFFFFLGCVKTEIEPSEKLPINFLGDSLTEANGQDLEFESGISYPSRIQKMLPSRKMTNIALGGQTTEQIIARQGGLPIYISIAGNKLNGLTEIPVDSIVSYVGGSEIKNNLLSKVDNDERSILGTINGVKCNLIRRARGIFPSQIELYYIKPLVGSNILIPNKSRFYVDQGYKQDSCISIIWVGRNNSLVTSVTRNNVLEIIKKGVAFNKSNKFIVLGILKPLHYINGTTGAINDDLMSEMIQNTYPNNFITMTPPTELEMKEYGYIPTIQDRIDISNGVFPTGMRRDNTHFADAGLSGNGIIANRVYKKLKELNY